MTKIIPYFYHDILARIVPGVATLALLGLANVRLPDYWATWMAGASSAQVILGPIISIAVAYVIGLLYEAALNSKVEHYIYHRAFARALIDAPLRAPPSKSNLPPSLTIVTRRATGWFHHHTTVHGDPEFDHVTRMVAEAKMFAFLVVPFLLFPSMILLQHALSIVPPPSRGANWIAALAIPFAVVLLAASFSRMHRRALQIIRYIEYGEPNNLRQLRNDLRAIRASLITPRDNPK